MTPSLDGLERFTLDGCIAAFAEDRPDAPALVDATRTFTYAQFEEAVARLAGALREMGLRPGGRLVAFPRRTWELPVLFAATGRAGGVFVPLDARADIPRIDPVLARGADLVFLPPGHDPLLEHCLRVLGDPGRVLRSRSAGGSPGLEEAMASGRPLPPSTDPEAVFYINSTSGSTGRPKGAPTTHANVQWNTRACLETYPCWREDEVFCCLFAPFAHPHEHWARTVATGTTAVLIDTLRPRTVLQRLVRDRVTWLFAIPSVFELLLGHLGEDRLEGSSLRTAESGGAVVTPELVRRAEAALGVDFIPIWGCTESTGVVLHVPPWEPDRRLDMLGKPVRHYRVRVDDPDPATGVGELCVSGPAVVSGYLDRPEETARKFRDGWYHTGDLVREEGGGYLRFMGRREEMIKVGGEKVYLLEIERALAGIEGVRQVVVVPARDAVRGEVPRAAVVVEPDSPLTQEDILSWARRNLPPRMVPRQVEFWDELPAGPSGKIDKRAIAAQVSRPLMLAVNSMIVEDRPLPEVFRLAAGLRDRYRMEVAVDLRSRRSEETDPAGLWTVAHANSDFNLLDPESVDAALALARTHGVPVAAASAYVGACHPEDVEVGLACIEAAGRLAEAAPDGTLVLRVLGGDLRARARGMRGRWQDIRRQLREECLATIRTWEAHARQLAERTGRRVVLGLEIHHGQYLADLHDIHHACKGLRELGWEHVGFIEDPANRFIASEGDRIGAMDFARMVRAWGGRILAYHLKDVRYLEAWSQFHPQPLQRVGEPVFVWGMHKFEWTPLGEGEVDLREALMAARMLADPPHGATLVSTEYVAGSRDEREAAALLDAYARMVRAGRPLP